MCKNAHRNCRIVISFTSQRLVVHLTWSPRCICPGNLSESLSIMVNDGVMYRDYSLFHSFCHVCARDAEGDQKYVTFTCQELCRRTSFRVLLILGEYRTLVELT